MKKLVRVAAAQFEIGVDVAANLATCLRMIEQAAIQQPAILVLPEFCNHASWYRDRDHSYAVAVELDGDFVRAIAAKAAQYEMFIMLNCTVRRENQTVTGTNILLNPQGATIAVTDKQVLMGNENNFLTPARACAPIIETPLGRLGMYSCMDGVINETPRGLALRGAQILLNSLNSFAHDEGSLHVPVRAAENKVFVVAANKVGWLVPPELAAVIAERVKIKPEQLHGAGESQIVAPDGTVLAKAPTTGEAVIFADIDPSQADYKTRPDGTSIFTSRRPSLYQALAQAGSVSPASAPTAVQAIAAQQLTDLPAAELVVLPELFGCTSAAPAENVLQGEELMRALQLVARQRQGLIATSIVERVGNGFAHTGVLIGAAGVVLQQRQIHACGRHSWATVLGAGVQVYDSPYGRIALIVGGDTIYPEAFRLAVLQGAHIVLCPTQILETWETQTGLIERAAENRLNVVVAAQTSRLILAASPDFTLWTEWHNRPFDGNISYPIVTQAHHEEQWITAPLYPAASQNRLVSQKTDLVDNRPHWLLEALVK